MKRLMIWASQKVDNNIMELQFQGHIWCQRCMIFSLKLIADTTQEDILPESGKQTDVTLSGNSSVIILELKQLSQEGEPSNTQLDQYHDQLRGYVETRQWMERRDKSGAWLDLLWSCTIGVRTI
jgi:hypothetical protein